MDHPGISRAIGAPPWHLWGQSQTLQIGPNNAGIPSDARSQQLANIDYRRPDTWQFQLMATVSSDSTAILPFQLDLYWRMRWGVGRANYENPLFCVMNLFSNTFSGPGPGQRITRRMASTVQFPPNTTGDLPSIVDHLAAQSIQCSVTAQYQGGISANQITIEVAAFFAPRSHTRPDWLIKHFSDELDGK